MPKQKTIYNDLEMMKAVAIHYAKEHNCNYNIIIYNPDDNGNFNQEEGSTYEFVRDSYFEKERPNVKLLHTTNDLLNIVQEPQKEIKHDIINDKRYTEPFENDGAYAD